MCALFRVYVGMAAARHVRVSACVRRRAFGCPHPPRVYRCLRRLARAGDPAASARRPLARARRHAGECVAEALPRACTRPAGIHARVRVSAHQRAYARSQLPSRPAASLRPNAKAFVAVLHHGSVCLRIMLPPSVCVCCNTLGDAIWSCLLCPWGVPAIRYLERKRQGGQDRLTGHAWPAQNTWPAPKTWPETYRCQQSHGGQPIGRWPALASAGQGNAPLPMRALMLARRRTLPISCTLQ
jgi:hypothetical protein